MSEADEKTGKVTAPKKAVTKPETKQERLERLVNTDWIINAQTFPNTDTAKVYVKRELKKTINPQTNQMEISVVMVKNKLTITRKGFERMPLYHVVKHGLYHAIENLNKDDERFLIEQVLVREIAGSYRAILRKKIQAAKG